MRIVASVPVEKVYLPGGLFTFRHAYMEVDVVRVIRRPSHSCRSTGKALGWYYQADIADPPGVCAEAVRIGPDGCLRVNVERARNPQWQPPVFPDGKNWVDLAPKNVQYAGAREASGVENRTKVPENTGFHPADVANQTEKGASC